MEKIIIGCLILLALSQVFVIIYLKSQEKKQKKEIKTQRIVIGQFELKIENGKAQIKPL